jgi:hypothetical protein
MSNGIRKALWLVCGCLAASAIALAAAESRRASRMKTLTVAPPGGTATRPSTGASGQGRSSSAAGGAQDVGPAQVVRFTVYPEGIRPAEEHASAGLVSVTVEDLGGVTEGLVVQDGRGAALGRVSHPQGRGRGSQRLRLERGQYRVFDPSRPQLQATLVVE